MKKLLLFVMILVCSGFVIAETCGTGSSTGMISYWRLDNATGDVVDSYYDNAGIVGGDVTRDVAGKVNKAFDFDGNGDYVRVNDHSSIDKDAGENMTWAFWININSFPTGVDDGDIILQKRGSGEGNSGYEFGLNDDGELFFQVDDGPNSFGILSSGLLSLNTWYFVTFVIEGGNGTIYLNGSFDNVNINANYANGMPNSYDLSIGYDLRGPATLYDLDGTLDEIAIYERALSAAEVQQLYSSSDVGNAYCDNPVQPDFFLENCPDGMISYWKFDVSESGNATDYYDNNDGTGGSGGTRGTSDPIWIPDGIANGAYDFDGSNDYISAPASLDGYDNISMELWFKAYNPGAWEGILSNYYRKGLSVGITSTYIHFSGRPYGLAYGNYAAQYLTAVQSDKWYHVVGVKEGNYLKLYVDGEFKVDTDLGDDQVMQAYESTIIGSDMGSGGNPTSSYFDGLVDEVAFYSRALTDSEIQQHYDAGLAGEGCCGGTILDIWDDAEGTTHDCNTYIEVWANYTNTTSGAVISGANCNLTFSDAPATYYQMIENGDGSGPYYNNSKSYTVAGTYNYTIECSTPDFDSLIESDNITLQERCEAYPGGPIIPEFSATTAILAIILVTLGVLVIRKRRNS